MTENQKKLAIIFGTVIIALFFLLSSKKAGTTIINKEAAPQYGVSVPGITLPPRSGYAVNIPTLPSATPYAFSPISPCMCNGMATSTPTQQQGPTYTNVYNAANNGPNIYNYGNNIASTGSNSCDYSNPAWVCCAFPDRC